MGTRAERFWRLRRNLRHRAVTFTVGAKQQFGSIPGWALHGDAKLAGVRIASHSWETETLPCTPDGILTEIPERDVLNHLAETTRRPTPVAAPTPCRWMSGIRFSIDPISSGCRRRIAELAVEATVPGSP